MPFPAVPFTIEAPPAANDPIITVSPPSQIFCFVDVGLTSVLPFTINNTGTGDLTVNSVSVTGAHPADFTVLNLVPATIVAPGFSTTFNVQFNPTAPGPKSANIDISSNDPGQPVFPAFVSGDGQDTAPPPPAGNPIITVVPAGAFGEFGVVPLGGLSDFFFDIRNDGDADLNVSSIVASGGPFAVITPLPGPILPQLFINVHVQFAPTAIGDFNGQVDIVSDAGPITVFLHGVGEDTTAPPPTGGANIFILQTNLQFPETPPSTTSQMPLDITNNDPVNSVVISFDFLQPEITVNPLTFTLGPNASNSFQVAQLTVDEFTIKYVHSSDISTLLAGNYSAFVVTTEGDFETPSFFFEPVPGGGSGPQIFGGGFFEEGGVTQVEIFWSQIQNDLTSVTVGSHVVSGPTVSPDTQSPNPEDIIIKGAVSALISTITPGLFDVNITSTSLGPLSFPQLSFEVHAPEFNLHGWRFKD